MGLRVRDVRLLVLGVVVGCGSTSVGTLGGADGGGRDAGHRDAEMSPEDAAVSFPDAEIDRTPCEVWCELELACRASNAENEIGDGFGGGAVCGYPDEGAALDHCVRECNGRGSGSFPMGVPATCVDCEAENLRRSCRPSRSWANCDPLCEPTYRIEFIRYALRDDLSCAPATEPAPLPVCPRGGYASAGANLEGTFPSSQTLTSTGSVESSDPLVIRLADGRTLSVSATNLPLPVLAIGQALAVDLHLNCPFWCEQTFVLRRLDGSLVYASWYGNRAMMPALPEMSFGYAFSPCTSHRDGCAGMLEGDLVITSTSAAPLRLAPGASGIVDRFVVAHGTAVRLFEVDCTDTPNESVTGAVMRR